MLSRWTLRPPDVAGLLERLYDVDAPSHVAWLMSISEGLAKNADGHAGVATSLFQVEKTHLRLLGAVPEHYATVDGALDAAQSPLSSALTWKKS